MKLHRLRLGGFGRLSQRDFDFGPGLNVVVGPNETGKSTLAAAIVGSLYGLSRAQKERWRPWSGDAYAAVLTYETANGASWEVHRAFDRDSKGVRVYDADGLDAAARVGEGRSLSPGESHLRIPLEVFVQTACVRQRAVALEPSSAGSVSGALAQALDGGPKEDAAIGALARLAEAIRQHVGTSRAHKNAPLKALREREAREARAADDARAALSSLGELREAIAVQRAEQQRDAAAAVELERRARSLRAAHVRARLRGLKEYRNELAVLQVARAAYDDVDAFSADRVAALDDAYHSWRSAESVADAAVRDAAEEALDDAERRELAERRADAGAFDDDAFGALRSTAAQADAARMRSAAASHDAAAARRDDGAARGFDGGFVAAAAVAALIAAGVAIAHWWMWTALAAVVTVVLGIAAFARVRSGGRARRSAEAKQRVADAALAEERLAAATVARVLEPFGIATMDELARKRERLDALLARERAAQRAGARARTAGDAAAAEAARFDTLASALLAGFAGSRESLRLAAQQRAARRREREGLDASLAMLTVRRGDILLGDDEFALQAEYDALLAAGAEPAADDDPHALRALERKHAELDARARAAERNVARLEGQLRAGEETVPDIAALDEALAATRAEIERLEAFGRAVELATSTVEKHKDEAHRAFARRLEEYSADVLSTLTGGRYAEIHLDPATLAVRVRIPETGHIEDLDRLSAGTRDQVALVVRLATARMFAEGLETPPLLLDDPFAFWDAERIARCLPVLVHGALDAQIVLFTASEELAAAAARYGAACIVMERTATAV